MATLCLTDAQQRALRALMAIEPVVGHPVPSSEVLGLVKKLMPCDALGVAVIGNDGTFLDEVVIPQTYAEMFPDDGESGPLYVGLMHWRRDRAAAESCGSLEGVQDGLALGFRNGVDAVSQIWFDRLRRDFDEEDLARLALMAPLLQRLLRERPTPHLPASLTVQERRVLILVANGMSNTEIAVHLFISVATVRKHLENAYRKLGVRNRMAAVVAFQGGRMTGSEQADRLQDYA
jgi:DNA-binding CsgD family transcriptional regulator